MLEELLKLRNTLMQIETKGESTKLMSTCLYFIEDMINKVPKEEQWVIAMTLIDYLKDIFTTPSVIIFGAITLIEIAPIKINPWKTLFNWIGKMINSDIQTEIKEMKDDLTELKKDFESKKAEDMRWEILNFANSCRRGVEHGKDSWRHAMSQLAAYESYTERKGITNGVIEEDAHYLRELYQERNRKNDFLQKGELLW